MTRMNVARLVAVGEPLEVGTADKPVPGARDVLVRVEACGLVPGAHDVVSGRAPFVLPDLPSIFGLDVSGVIEAVGEHVVGPFVGQRVYVDPRLVCGTCRECRQQRTDLCRFACLRGYFAPSKEGVRLMNQYPVGGLAEYVVAPASSVATLPDNIDFVTAARFGHLGTSFAALRRGELGAGHTLVVNGVTGTLGVAAVMIALALGVTKIFGIGRDRDQMARVTALAPRRVETRSSEDGLDLVDWVRTRTAGLGADVLYDCSGRGQGRESTDALVEAVRTTGRVVVVSGDAEDDIVRSHPDILTDGVRVSGSNWFTSAEVDDMIAMIGAGVLDVSALEHRIFSLVDVHDAWEVVGSRPGGFTNVVVTPPIPTARPCHLG